MGSLTVTEGATFGATTVGLPDGAAATLRPLKVTGGLNPTAGGVSVTGGGLTIFTDGLATPASSSVSMEVTGLATYSGNLQIDGDVSGTGANDRGIPGGLTVAHTTVAENTGMSVVASGLKVANSGMTLSDYLQVTGASPSPLRSQPPRRSK